MEAAEAEAIVTILDSCWFEQLILSRGLRMMPSGSISILNQDEDVEAPSISSSGSRIEEIYRVPSALLRSMSDQLSSQASFLSGSPSPSSVLRSPVAHLHPVESGKDISEESLLGFENQSSLNKYRGREVQRKKKKVLSKSLSELEFEELKGFMDLGFVFSEEDKDSSLASIIPGLHRLGKKKDEQQRKHEEQEEEQEPSNEGRQVDCNVKETDNEIASSSPPPVISRPYLSETWEWLDKRKKEKPLANWNFPALNNETDMKDNLRWWAHTVASNVR